MVTWLNQIKRQFSSQDEQHVEMMDEGAELRAQESKANAIAMLNGLIQIEQDRYEKEIAVGATKRVDPDRQ